MKNKYFVIRLETRCFYFQLDQLFPSERIGSSATLWLIASISIAINLQSSPRATQICKKSGTAESAESGETRVSPRAKTVINSTEVDPRGGVLGLLTSMASSVGMNSDLK